MRYFLQIPGYAGGTGSFGRYGTGFFLAVMLLFPLRAVAAPSVAVSIRPLHSLVAAVMDEVGVPALIVQGAGSEHGYQLRPDDAKKLASADIVFWAGPQMETFLVKPLENLSSGAAIVALANGPGVHLLTMRSGGNFGLRHHVREHDDETDGSGDDHRQDLHFWLDPQNAGAALHTIADILARKDPANAGHYRTNAKAYEQRLKKLMAEVDHELAPFRGRPFIVFHDAYQYFEKRFNMPAAGSITVSPEQAPGVRWIAELRNKVKKLGSVCIFSEPQFEPRLVATVIEGTHARTGVLDPLGADIRQGPEQYPALIRNLADSLKNCLASE